MVAKLVYPLAVAVVGGLAAAGKGVADVVQARSIAKKAKRRHDVAVCELEEVQRVTQGIVEEYGRSQLRAQRDTIGRFADWLENHSHLVERLDRRIVDGVEVRVPSIPAMKFDVEQARVGLAGGFGALGAAASAQGAALWGVSTFATASTGAAISGLSGAAATNATLAWLGGGSLAAGGGGMAAGAIVLNMIMIAPGVLIGGLAVGVLGAKEKTKAVKYASEINVSIEHVETAKERLRAVRTRIAELRSVLSRLVARAEEAIDELEAQDFDPDEHGHLFVSAYQLITAIAEVIETPVTDPGTGDLTDISIEIVEKYS
ncbi:hypothetical protein E3O19_01825 [Cryobacterium algoritolerans]|uniref:Glycine zipper family protein n=1 Tax=Cryobacterium algoritolerans TaxID=1259184 RepID=A0A4R8WW70_9MICO|nr:hypothetical protein [Cryobacterium algoritolerans]TFC19724.1 hypothetical protein E3O19_01825 [Cryobacterium algoritolerans]